MRRLFIIIIICCSTLFVKGQILLHPDSDSMFTSLFRDGVEWGFRIKNNYMIGMSATKTTDGYSSGYTLKILIKNLTDSSYTFDPDLISAEVYDEQDTKDTVKLYTNVAYQKKIQNAETAAMIVLGLMGGLNSAFAGTQTTYVPITSNGYTTTQTVVNYNAFAQQAAQQASFNNILAVSSSIEQDKKIAEQGYLKKTTIFSQEGIIGSLNTEKAKGKKLVISIPIDDEKYNFSWDIRKQKKKKKRSNLS